MSNSPISHFVCLVLMSNLLASLAQINLSTTSNVLPRLLNVAIRRISSYQDQSCLTVIVSIRL